MKDTEIVGTDRPMNCSTEQFICILTNNIRVVAAFAAITAKKGRILCLLTWSSCVDLWAHWGALF